MGVGELARRFAGRITFWGEIDRQILLAHGTRAEVEAARPASVIALSSVTSGFSSNVYTFDAADTVSTGSSATLANVYGCLVYDDTITTPVADQGVCYNYFGGANSVTDGTFTIAWSASGIFAITA
jgi:hypothetical protein